MRYPGSFDSGGNMNEWGASTGVWHQPPTITLSTGRAVPVTDIEYDDQTSQFFYQGADVTDSVSESQFNAYWPVQAEAYRAWLSDQHTQERGGTVYDPNAPQNQPWNVFTGGVMKDVAKVGDTAHDVFIGDPGKKSTIEKAASTLFWAALIVGGLVVLSRYGKPQNFFSKNR